VGDDPPGTKRCPSCPPGAPPKSLEDFGRDKRTSDGHRAQCKDCVAAAARDARAQRRANGVGPKPRKKALLPGRPEWYLPFLDAYAHCHDVTEAAGVAGIEPRTFWGALCTDQGLIEACKCIREMWLADLQPLMWYMLLCGVDLRTPQMRGPTGPYARHLHKRALKIRALIAYEQTCAYCSRKGNPLTDPDGFSWHLDRINPGTLGGTYEEQNVALACRTCNLQKSDTPLTHRIRSLAEVEAGTP
jgi:hypothetical protein